MLLYTLKSLVAQLCLTLCDPMDCSQPTRLLHPQDFPGKNIGVGCHFLLQRIFLTKGSNLDLPHCRQTLYHLNYQGSPFVYLTFFNLLDSVDLLIYFSISLFFFFFKFLFVYFWLSWVLVAAWTLSSCHEQICSLLVMLRLLIVVASLIAKQGSRVLGLSSCGTRA